MAGVKKEGKYRKRVSDEVARRSPVRANSAAAASSGAESGVLDSDGDLVLAASGPPPQSAAALAAAQMPPPLVPPLAGASGAVPPSATAAPSMDCFDQVLGAIAGVAGQVFGMQQSLERVSAKVGELEQAQGATALRVEHLVSRVEALENRPDPSAASVRSEPLSEPPPYEPRPTAGSGSTLAATRYIEDTLIVGGFNSRTNGATIKEVIEQMVAALPAHRRSAVKYVYPEGLLGNKGFIKTKPLGSSDAWDLVESLRSNSTLLTERADGTAQYWCSRAKSSAALAAGGKLKAAREVLTRTGKVANGQTLEVDTRRRRIIAIPSGDAVAQVLGAADLSFNWQMLATWGISQAEVQGGLAKSREERQWL